MSPPAADLTPLPHLPVRPGTPGERNALQRLLDRARQHGVSAPRLHGFAGRANPLLADAFLLAIGAIATFIGLFSVGTTLAVGLVLAVTAGARALGSPGPDSLALRVPCWSLLLLRPRAETRLIVAAPVDRFVPDARIGWAVFGATLIVPLSAIFSAELRAVSAVVLVVGAALTAWRGQGDATGGVGAESRLADALIGLAARLTQAGEERVVVMVSGCASASADGVRAVLDWWALSPQQTRVLYVIPESGADAGARALLRDGYTVEVSRLTEPELLEREVRRLT